MTYLLALDQGTSSSRAIVFDAATGTPRASAQREFEQLYPHPGWVEHDPRTLVRTQRETAQQALQQAGIRAGEIASVGMSNQRETTLVWNRRTGEPVYNAIVWQDRRTQPICDRLLADGLLGEVRERTGLIIDPYFAGTKLAWILENVDGARAAAERGELAFGTVDTWLIWHLTRGRVHATDVSNASRTLLWNVRTRQWDDTLLRALDIPPSLLPEVHPSSHDYGAMGADWFGEPLMLGGVAGDQQAALFGQVCFTAGSAKNTYGTGCFMLKHLGTAFSLSDQGLITTTTAQHGEQAEYAIEGSVFIGGAVVQWLRDNLQAIETSADVQQLAESVPDAGGVMFVPAFTGLGAPYWKPKATGALVGLTRGTTLGHIARAALDSIAFQSAALLRAMGVDGQDHGVRQLKVDGGAAVNDLLMQTQADLLGVEVVRPAVVETTALGAVYLAGLASGVYRSRQELEALWRAERVFTPRLSRAQADARMAEWEEAVRRTTGER
ncbi:glycerol kinase GlpK [Verticiella sediminum]|uniref:Glycerol kinase n=1 Tax=Verticiella sediminum TaxID=1247510 RepID=A0A556AVN0_9BURK|nr:glycerol kinase GlpK [Verticiella sediminum]TSH97008.1 glycerol kinase GlpK [Verticiella sediminum]